MRHRLIHWMCLLLLMILAVSTAVAQTTTATLRGKIVDENGYPFPTAEVNATNLNTGFRYSATAGADGSYRLSGLAPGSYRIEVSGPMYRAVTRDLTVLVGQTIDADFRLQPNLVVSEEITVVGNTAVEMETHQVATNVTQQQIENLPQPDRNFLNFAALAPGVTMSTDPTRKEIRAGGQGSQSTNVFIDGVSFKNDLILGGVIGQDASRGNPFPQNAVREFRVITQNFSAEYQKSSSAIITAVTQSGTNDFRGNVFAYFQDKSFIEDDPFMAPGADKPPYERLQYGVSIGGPIIRDRMHFFASYEANDQDRQERVVLGPLKNTPFGQQFLDREGVFTQPFREDLFFGKFSFQPGGTQVIDLSASYRNETDIRSFGGQNTYEVAEDVKQNIWSAVLRHQLNSMTWLNEASLSYSSMDWHPQPLNFEDPRFEYQGIGAFGGRGGRQNAIQTRFSIRDDITFSALQAAGDHTLKVGVLAEFLDYTMIKNFRFQPVYRFREQENFEFPWQAALAFGEPDMASDNQSYGLYAQDEWHVNDALSLSLGLRWDYETKMMDTDYVTPAYVRTALTGFAPENFFSDGDDRESPTDNFAPRLGATYDLFQDGRTVLFAGAGRYYDRILFNELVDVRFKENYRETFFEFSRDGRPGTIMWDPKYLTKEGLQQLAAAGGGRHEVWLFDNDAEVPYSDQWNIGFRQSFAGMVGSLSYGSVRSYNNIQWSFAPFSLNANGTCCNVPASHPGAVLMSNQDEKTYYDAIYATLDRPMNANSRYGFNLAYTYAESEILGDERGSVTFPPPGTTTHAQHPTSGHEKHRIVANGMMRIPWDVLLSTLIQYGSGPQIVGTRIVSNIGWPAGERFVHHGEGRSWSSVDLRGEKAFNLGGTSLGLILEAFNLFNTDRFSCYQDFEPIGGNPNLLQPGCIVQGSQRRFQAGIRVGF